jgi:hypothetical protein
MIPDICLPFFGVCSYTIKELYLRPNISSLLLHHLLEETTYYFFDMLENSTKLGIKYEHGKEQKRRPTFFVVVGTVSTCYRYVTASATL